MNPKMNEAASLYLKEIAVLEDARDALETSLTAIWTEVTEATKKTLDELSHSVEGKTGIYDPKSDPSHHERLINKKDIIVFKLMIDDPRRTRGGYKLTINCTNQERAKLSRIPGARDKYEELAKLAGVQQIRWTRSAIWDMELQVDPNDLDRIVGDLSSKMSDIFKSFVEFVDWSTKLNQHNKSSEMKTEPAPSPYSSPGAGSESGEA